MGYYATPINGSRKLFLIPSLWNITHHSSPFNCGCSASSLIWSNLLLLFLWGENKNNRRFSVVSLFENPNYCCPPIILNFEESKRY